MTDRIFTHTDPDKSITVDFGHGEDISNEISYHFENGVMVIDDVKHIGRANNFTSKKVKEYLHNRLNER